MRYGRTYDRNRIGIDIAKKSAVILIPLTPAPFGVLTCCWNLASSFGAIVADVGLFCTATVAAG